MVPDFFNVEQVTSVTLLLTLSQNNDQVGDKVTKELILKAAASIFLYLSVFPSLSSIFNTLRLTITFSAVVLCDSFAELALGRGYGCVDGGVGQVGVTDLQLPVDLKNLTQLCISVCVCVCVCV